MPPHFPLVSLSPMSATIVGRNRFPCLFSKKCFAAIESTGCSDSTSSLMVSVKGERSLLASLNGSTSAGARLWRRRGRDGNSQGVLRR